MNKTRLLLTLLAAVCLSVLLTSPTQAQIKNTSEVLQYDISYFGINAAKGSIEVQPHEENYYRIIARGKTISVFSALYTVDDHMETITDRQSLLPREFKVDFNENHYSRQDHYFFDHKNQIVTGHKTPVEITSQTVDPLSGFYMIRNMELKPGTTVERYICDGRKHYLLRADVIKRRSLSTQWGKIPCILIRPDIAQIDFDGVILNKKGKISIWLTDDEYKIPIEIRGKLVIGSLVARLEQADEQSRAYIDKIAEVEDEENNYLGPRRRPAGHRVWRQ